jgi:putative oxidoreductase
MGWQVPYCFRMQRLFSTFPNSWPGRGLLILRLTAALTLIRTEHAVVYLGDTGALLLRCVSIALASLLVLGLGTPIAALGVALTQVVATTLSRQLDSSSVVAAALGLGLSMLGPGAWSVDARLFGRKRIV